MFNRIGEWVFGPTKPTARQFRTDNWYRTNGFDKCILCGIWVRNPKVGFVHPLCIKCAEDIPPTKKPR